MLNSELHIHSIFTFGDVLTVLKVHQIVQQPERLLCQIAKTFVVLYYSLTLYLLRKEHDVIRRRVMRKEEANNNSLTQKDETATSNIVQQIKMM